MTTETLYDTLGLASFAEGAMVDQAYWHLAKTYQALVDADPRARQALDELNAAYAVLGTPRLREQYDATLAPPGAPGRRARQPRRTSPPVNATEGRKLRFALPKWPFGKAEPSSQISEARVRQLGPVSSVSEEAVVLQSQLDVPRPTRTSDVQDLHTSTARMLERWRASTAASTKAAEPEEPAPDMTLVDIFKTEEDLEAREDPLAAVMDILKAPRGAVPTVPER